MKKSFFAISIVLLLPLILTGCFVTDHAIIFDEDWSAYVAMDIISNEFGPSEEELNNMVKRLKLFYPEFRKIESGEQYIRYISNNKVSFEQLEFIKKEKMENGNIRLNINLPPLITARDYEGKAKGVPMILELYIPGEVIEANTLDYNNDYVMQGTFKGEKRARVIWQLREEQLTSPTKLWVRLKPFNEN